MSESHDCEDFLGNLWGLRPDWHGCFGRIQVLGVLVKRFQKGDVIWQTVAARDVLPRGKGCWPVEAFVLGVFTRLDFYLVRDAYDLDAPTMQMPFEVAHDYYVLGPRFT